MASVGNGAARIPLKSPHRTHAPQRTAHDTPPPRAAAPAAVLPLSPNPDPRIAASVAPAVAVRSPPPVSLAESSAAETLRRQLHNEVEFRVLQQRAAAERNPPSPSQPLLSPQPTAADRLRAHSRHASSVRTAVQPVRISAPSNPPSAQFASARRLVDASAQTDAPEPATSVPVPIDRRLSTVSAWKGAVSGDAVAELEERAERLSAELHDTMRALRQARAQARRYSTAGVSEYALSESGARASETSPRACQGVLTSPPPGLIFADAATSHNESGETPGVARSEQTAPLVRANSGSAVGTEAVETPRAATAPPLILPGIPAPARLPTRSTFRDLNIQPSGAGRSLTSPLSTLASRTLTSSAAAMSPLEPASTRWLSAVVASSAPHVATPALLCVIAGGGFRPAEDVWAASTSSSVSIDPAAVRLRSALSAESCSRSSAAALLRQLSALCAALSKPTAAAAPADSPSASPKSSPSASARGALSRPSSSYTAHRDIGSGAGPLPCQLPTLQLGSPVQRPGSPAQHPGSPAQRSGSPAHRPVVHAPCVTPELIGSPRVGTPTPRSQQRTPTDVTVGTHPQSCDSPHGKRRCVDPEMMDGVSGPSPAQSQESANGRATPPQRLFVTRFDVPDDAHGSAGGKAVRKRKKLSLQSSEGADDADRRTGTQDSCQSEDREYSGSGLQGDDGSVSAWMKTLPVGKEAPSPGTARAMVESAAVRTRMALAEGLHTPLTTSHPGFEQYHRPQRRSSEATAGTGTSHRLRSCLEQLGEGMLELGRKNSLESQGSSLVPTCSPVMTPMKGPTSIDSLIISPDVSSMNLDGEDAKHAGQLRDYGRFLPATTAASLTSDSAAAATSSTSDGKPSCGAT
eukprot:TRINITY_DN17837_c0_g1_i1.p1 TRINITY_DN17837_c0_g1~~TRINITY_DN17837_c0_g1_i1.p1  ORF type:complete len:863 (+),score=45.45 TRINITY_DN17837_c0_g1_i1:75-2663(+)